MHILIIAESYPTKGDPSFPFVQQLAYSLCIRGYEVSVVAPQSITKNIIRKIPFKPQKSIDYSPEGQKITVIRPPIITFSNTKNHFLKLFAHKLMSIAIKNGIKQARQVDIIYCYFWHIGLLTASISKNIPLFVQASECEIIVETYMIKPKYLQKINGVICASKKNFIDSVNTGLAEPSKCKVIVNGYRPDQFYPMDKREQRKKLGFPQDSFIVVFVGGFIERKGINELSSALLKLDDVSSIFIGRGNNPPKCERILFQGSVEHEKIAEYLNCADIFVLPTRAEGCCNAIIEALACGLPVISSHKSFNDEILDETCSIRVDEMNVEEIYEKIRFLKENPSVLERLSKGAIEKAKQLTIDIRSSQIDSFIREKKDIVETENTISEDCH